MTGGPLALILGALLAGFALGRLSGSAPPVTGPALQAVATLQGDPRELVPLTPGPDDRRSPGAPGPAPGEGECTVLMFRDGQFYRLQPGTPEPGGDARGGDGELFPLLPTPPAPGGAGPGLPPFPLPPVTEPEMRT